MKLACSTVFVCFNYSTSFSNDDFTSFTNSTKFKIKMSQLIVQIYKLLPIALRAKARVVKVIHNFLHIVFLVNQSKT